MMIVSLARAGLRDEFAMADEAFALSPISARATLPSEEDYDAINQAFMETSRGRWFLGEYAKRNRNADTSMVLDAVARIEQTIAAQKQPAADSGLTEALAAIRRAVDEAYAAATVAVEGLALEESLAPIRKGARIIREISWRWREIGADGRICDLLDSQVGAIEGACGQVSSADAKGALSAAFDLIKARIAEFDDGDTAAPPAAEAAEIAQETSATSDAEAGIDSQATPTEAVAAKAEALVVITEVADHSTEGADLSREVTGLAPDVADPATEVAELATEAADVNSEVADLNTEAADGDPRPVAAEAADVTPEAADEMSEAADAYDESLLDMIALEMAAPDPADIDEALEAETDEIDAAMPPPTKPAAATPGSLAVAGERAEPMATAMELAEPMTAIADPPPVQPSIQPSLEPSLGSSLIASGIVRRPLVSDADPLAPIRRMSQAEKVAFFS
jgi:hypothetical protein